MAGQVKGGRPVSPSGHISPARRLAADASLLGAALMISYLESFIPQPLPGVKLGLANICVLAAAYLTSLGDAAAVSLCRVTVCALLFGTPTTFWFSLCGAAASFLALAALRRVPEEKISLVGVSAVCAAFHSAGQMAAAAAVFGSPVLRWLPLMLLVSDVTGALTGALARQIIKILKQYGKTGCDQKS